MATVGVKGLTFRLDDTGAEQRKREREREREMVVRVAYMRSPLTTARCRTVSWLLLVI